MISRELNGVAFFDLHLLASHTKWELDSNCKLSSSLKDLAICSQMVNPKRRSACIEPAAIDERRC